MHTRNIPTSVPALIAFGGRSLAAVRLREASLAIAQNTALRVAADYIDLVGESGPNPTIRGREADWQLKREELKTARAALRMAKDEAREFWSDTVDLLKIHLGRTWNPAWEAAGFNQFTLSTSEGNPLPMLLRIRAYLRDHPAHENAPLNITAAQADARIAAVQSAEQGVDAANGACKQAAAARKASVKRLRARLGGLRNELDQLLEPTDLRWYEFGFSRPVDRKAPEPVKGLTATPGQVGTVLVQHGASARAIDYRVSWKVIDGGGDTTEAGLFADLALTLSSLPSGAAIMVSVTSRNEAGETPPASVTVVVP